MDIFKGEWKLIESVNFDEFLKEIGISYIFRKIAIYIKSTLFIDSNEDNNKWTYKNVSTFKTYEFEFELDKEFDEKTPAGVTFKSIIEFKDGKLIQTQRDTEGNEVSVVERLVDQEGKLVMNLRAGNVHAKRVYGRASH